MSRVEDLREVYDALKQKLADSDGSGAAALAREIRIIGEKLEMLETPEEASLVDELAAKRAKSGSSRPPSRRRKSG